MSAPISPADVVSPKSHWALIDVLEEDRDGVAVALGNWDGDKVLAMRWNGSDEQPIGMPQSRGLPTWFILPRWANGAILSALNLNEDKLRMAKSLLPKPEEGA